MITVIDTNILFDILIPNPKYEASSRSLLDKASCQGQLMICETVAAELGAHFPQQDLFLDFLGQTRIRVTPTPPSVLHDAGRAWRGYLEKRPKGSLRRHMVADFMIAAHAAYHADLLLTRDRGFYRDYFPGLTIESG